MKSGIEVLRSQNFELLGGKKVGLVTNASGVDSKLKSTVDILFDAENVNLAALYGPEHGVRGNIEGGEKIDTYIDEHVLVWNPTATLVLSNASVYSIIN